jgi:putative addiction module killer protein
VPKEREIRIYVRADGTEPYTAWEQGLKDRQARARIRVRLGRLRLGTLGDTKRVGEGVGELRLHAGPGYRVYYGREGNDVFILLCGGDKGSQTRDIERAERYWRDYRSRDDGKE